MNIFIILQPTTSSCLSFLSSCIYSLHSSAPCPSSKHWRRLVITKVKITVGLSGSFKRHKLRETSANVSAHSIRRPEEDPGPCSLRKACERAKREGGEEQRGRKKSEGYRWGIHQIFNMADDDGVKKQMKQRSTDDWHGGIHLEGSFSGWIMCLFLYNTSTWMWLHQSWND